MPAKPWSQAQAKNKKEFESRLDKVTNWLVDGDWHGSYRSWTEAVNDSVVKYTANKEDLNLISIEFIHERGGILRALETRVEDGLVKQESFIVGVQPFEDQFYMNSVGDNDIAFGNINRRTNTISITKIEASELGDETAIGIYQFTNLLA